MESTVIKIDSGPEAELPARSSTEVPGRVSVVNPSSRERGREREIQHTPSGLTRKNSLKIQCSIGKVSLLRLGSHAR